MAELAPTQSPTGLPTHPPERSRPELLPRPQRQRRQRRQRRGWALWRRRLGRSLLVGALLFTVANTGLEAWTRREFPTTTTAGAGDADARTRGYFPHTYWVFFPGFGIDFCPDVERALRPVTRRTGQSFCVAPSPVALDPYEIADVVRSRVTQDRTDPTAPVTIYLYGISMGGMIAYDVARLLDGRDHVSVRAVVFDSSPAGIESVRGPARAVVRGGAALRRTPNLPWGIPNPLKGGPLSRFAGHLAEAGADCISRHRSPTWADTDFAWYKATRVVSSSLANQLDYIASFGADSRERPPEAATYAYLGAANPAADTTVDVTRAIAAYRARLDPLPLHVYPIAGGTHASGNTTTAAYVAALAAFAEQAGLPSTDDIDWLHANVPLWAG